MDEEVAAAYPGWPMISPAYPTTDHIIPFALFALLAADLPRRWAAERWQQKRAIVQALAEAFSDEVEVRVNADQLLEDAFPQPAGAVVELPVLFPKPET